VTGQGRCTGYSDKAFDYEDHFFYIFRMRDGKIKDLREYSEPWTIPTLIGWDLIQKGDPPALPGWQ